MGEISGDRKQCTTLPWRRLTLATVPPGPRIRTPPKLSRPYDRRSRAEATACIFTHHFFDLTHSATRRCLKKGTHRTQTRITRDIRAAGSVRNYLSGPDQRQQNQAFALRSGAPSRLNRDFDSLASKAGGTWDVAIPDTNSTELLFRPHSRPCARTAYDSYQPIAWPKTFRGPAMRIPEAPVNLD